MLDRTWPSRITAALVSSHEVSSASKVTGPLFGGHFLAFYGVSFLGGDALAVEGYAFEQVHGAIQLHVVGIANSLLILRFHGIDATRRALKEDVMFFLIGH